MVSIKDNIAGLFGGITFDDPNSKNPNQILLNDFFLFNISFIQKKNMI